MRQRIYWNRICEVTTSTYPLGTLDSVVFFFETILYTSKEFLMITISSRISHQLRDIYSICRCRWNVVSNTYWLYIWAPWRVCYKRQELFTLRGYLCSTLGFWWGPFCWLFLCFLCCPITFPTNFHHISWACFFNPQCGIACLQLRNTLYSGNPDMWWIVVEIRRGKHDSTSWIGTEHTYILCNRFKK